MNSEDGMECPVCWEGFNDSENTPYVLWCGHSLCRNCVKGLHWAVIRLPLMPVQLPLLISCPWCQFLTLRMTWKGTLKYPCKNFFLLWMVESLKGSSVRQRPNADTHIVHPAAQWRAAGSDDIPHVHTVYVRPRERRVVAPQQRPISSILLQIVHEGWNPVVWQIWAARALTYSVQLTAKLPLVFLFLFILVYVVPFSAVILAVYAVVTIVFAVPSFLVVYFSYPSLEWLGREIVT